MDKNLNVKTEIANRVEWIKSLLVESKTNGVVLGNSGGKDCALVFALCRLATENTVGIIMPCGSSRNYESDRDDALILAKHYDFKTLEVDLTSTKAELKKVLSPVLKGDTVTDSRLNSADININPRLRMTTLYAYAQAHNCLVAGTGNHSEASMGYFTKWGDGGYDFNPIADLTVREVYAMLKALDAPNFIFEKEPSAGLFEGQTDESDMGISYNAIDDILLYDKGSDSDRAIVEKARSSSEHKRQLPKKYSRK